MIFYESFYEAATHLSPEDRTAFIGAVLEYGCEGNMPDIHGVPLAMFLMAKPLIDANSERKKNGAKGGRPKKDAGKFINFQQSGTDWDSVAEKVIENQ